MSTKVTIRHSRRSDACPGFYLYHDVLDGLGIADDPQTDVYLRLDGVAVALETLSEGGALVTITLPRETARMLGLLRPGTAPGIEQV